MVSLLDLPTETLSQILQLVGSEQLQGCVENHLVCKRWYRLVHAVIYTLDGLIDRGVGPNDYGEFSVKFDRADSALSMDVTESEYGSPLFVPVEGEWRTVLDTGRRPSPFRFHAYDLLRSMVGRIHKKQARKFILRLSLEELDIAAYHEAQRSLTLSTLVKGLPKSLNHITIDNGGEPASNTFQWEHHLCNLFLDKQRFPLLSTLVLRLPSICNQIFHANTSNYPPLTTLVLNLSLAIRPTMSSTQCKCCHDKAVTSSELVKQLEKAGLDAVPFLPELRTFHIVETDVVDSVMFYGGRKMRTGSSTTQVVHNGHISGHWRYKCNVLDWSHVDPYDTSNTPDEVIWT